MAFLICRRQTGLKGTMCEERERRDGDSWLEILASVCAGGCDVVKGS